MPAGFNIKLDIYRETWADDVIGGATGTSSVVYRDVRARIHATAPDQQVYPMGLGTIRPFTVTVSPHTLTLYEKDEIVVVYPITHPYYNQRFRVDGVTIGNNHPSDRRGLIILNVSRDERAHANQ